MFKYANLNFQNFKEGQNENYKFNSNYIHIITYFL